MLLLRFSYEEEEEEQHTTGNSCPSGKRFRSHLFLNTFIYYLPPLHCWPPINYHQSLTTARKKNNKKKIFFKKWFPFNDVVMLIRTGHVEEHRLQKYQQNNTAVHPSNPHWILHQSHNKSAEDSIKNQTESGRMGNVRVVMTGGSEFSYRTLLSNFKLLIHFIGIGNETKWPCEDTKRAETANVYWACFWRRITRRIRRRISQFANVNMVATTPSSSFPNKHHKNFKKKKRKEKKEE